MAAGFVYNLKPKEVQEERYDVSTGIRRRGNYILDVAGLEIGSYVPSFLPIAADGKNGAVVQSIDRTNADYDEITLAAAFGAKVKTGDTLFEASAEGGTTPKAVANSALYENHKVTEGINSVTLLMRAFEIEPEKLVMPFCAADKANLPHFQFNE